MTATALAIPGLHIIADNFDHVLLDQWGTLHEGKSIFPAARNCVMRLRSAGKRVLVLSNSGKRAASNRQRLAALGLPPDTYDGVLSSGEVAWTGLRTQIRAPFVGLGRICFLIARNSDRSIVEGLDLGVTTEIGDADFVLLAGLDDAACEPELWRERLTKAAQRRLPMLCANPDLMMFGATGLLPAPGALARFYERLGGEVAYVGKPHAPIFAAALDRLDNPYPRRVLMIGDSIDHDIAGARAAGMLTLLLSAGVHGGALVNMPDQAAAIRSLAGADARMPHWTMTHLAW
jgi:HAD superfamily hydrolase (TIGR01459 family)